MKLLISKSIACMGCGKACHTMVETGHQLLNYWCEACDAKVNAEVELHTKKRKRVK